MKKSNLMMLEPENYCHFFLKLEQIITQSCEVDSRK